MITYGRVSVAATLPNEPDGPTSRPWALRVRALREAMGLSLRDLAERSGVSAPMLSQVERGETSPTLAVAGRVAAGLDLTLSQLLRLDEDGHVVVVRGGRAAKAPPPRPYRRGADAAAARPARRRLAASARPGRGDRRTRRPAASRAGQPRDRGRPRGRDDAGHRRPAARAPGRRQRHLRRRPRSPLRERRRPAGRAAGRRRGGPAERAERGRRRCSTRSGTRTRSPTG